ncbi:hypothetical protein BASA81_006901 [Batrachochytrium salamandrivorans]|nr:hypothetical protein BASA81_006901 [Batrachochytrium salamandrivorans]
MSTFSPTASTNPFDSSYCQDPENTDCLLWGVSWQNLILAGIFFVLGLGMRWVMMLVFGIVGQVLNSYNKRHWKSVLYEGLFYWTVWLGKAGFFWLGMYFLTFPPDVNAILRYLYPIPFVLCLFFWTNAVFDTLILLRKSEFQHAKETNITRIAGFSELMRIFKYLFFLIDIFIAVVIFGGDVASFLNSAKLLGLIIVFAFQPWLKNLIGGISIFNDGKYVLGDEVRFSSSIQGVVKDMTLRTTTLECKDKSLCIIPNGRLLELPVANLSNRERNMITLTFPISYSIGVDQVRNLLPELRASLAILHPDIIKTQISIQQNYELVIKVFTRKSETLQAGRLLVQEIMLAMAEVTNKRVGFQGMSRTAREENRCPSPKLTPAAPKTQKPADLAGDG